MAYYQIALRLLLSFIIAVSPIILINSANASNVGGWNLSNPVARGASAVYDATKNVVINGKKFIKESSVKITPTASQVAKTIGRTAGVIIAVEMLIGAVDWVLDPANNRVIYYEDPPPKELLPKLWVSDSRMDGKDGVSTAEQACRNAAFSKSQAQATNNYMYTIYKSVTLDGLDTAICTYDAYNTFSGEYYGTTTHRVQRKINSAYNPEAEDERREKYLPYDAVAQQLISNASSGQPEAQAHTMAAAATEVAEAEKDDAKARPIASQAEANAETKPADAAEAEKANEAQGQSKPNEANPDAMDISLEFPVFCSWAPTVCEAAQVVISFPNTLTGWYTDTKTKAEEWASSIAQSWAAVKDWATTQKQDEPTELEIPKPEQQTVDTDVSFNASCPAPYTLASFTAFGSSHNWTIDFSDMCSAITTFVRPVVIAMGALSAALIVGGVRDNG